MYECAIHHYSLIVDFTIVNKTTLANHPDSNSNILGKFGKLIKKLLDWTDELSKVLIIVC